MKVLITESQLDTYVFKTLDEMFPEDEVHYVAPYEYDDETGEEGDDECRLLFYLGDYEGDDDDGIFRWYDYCYWNTELISVSRTIPGYMVCLGTTSRNRLKYGLKRDMVLK